MAKKKYIILAKCYDRKGRLLSVGTNSYNVTHPVQAHFARLAGYPEKVYIHAEIQAILRAKDKEIYKITIERYDSEGNPKIAAPCPVCALMIKEYNIKLVEFTKSNAKTND